MLEDGCRAGVRKQTEFPGLQLTREPSLKQSRGIGNTMRALMHLGGSTGSVAAPRSGGVSPPDGAAAAAARGGRGRKGGFGFSSLRDKLMTMVCVANGADSTAAGLTAARGPQMALEAYTIPIGDHLPDSVAMTEGRSSLDNSGASPAAGADPKTAGEHTATEEFRRRCEFAAATVLLMRRRML